MSTKSRDSSDTSAASSEMADKNGNKSDSDNSQPQILDQPKDPSDEYEPTPPSCPRDPSPDSGSSGNRTSAKKEFSELHNLVRAFGTALRHPTMSPNTTK